ncbi:MAG: DALR domain-containing protein, partial [Actinomycetota bacterium]
EPFVRYWVHAGLVQFESEKMSKSLGNTVLAHDVVEEVPGEAARYWALSSSYRAQAVFSDESLHDATQAYERIKTFYESVRHVLGADTPVWPEQPRRPPDDAHSEGPGAEYLDRFLTALDDDFNSAEALAAVHDLVRAGNRHMEGAQRDDASDRKALAQLFAVFLELATVLNFRFESTAGDSELLAGLIDYLLGLREQARGEKAFDRADAIRAKLEELGVAVEDTPAGPRWRIE